MCHAQVCRNNRHYLPRHWLSRPRGPLSLDDQWFKKCFHATVDINAEIASPLKFFEQKQIL